MQMSHFEAKMQQIRFLVSVCLSVCLSDGVWHLRRLTKLIVVLFIWSSPVRLYIRTCIVKLSLGLGSNAKFQYGATTYRLECG